MSEYENGFSLSYWEGALVGCQEEAHSLEKAVGMGFGESRISGRLRQFAALLDRAKQQEQRMRELEAWIPQAYKEGFLDGRADESEGFDAGWEANWEASMAKMVFDEKLEQP